MRCKLGDRVIVIKGANMGAVGTIVDKAECFAHVFANCDWFVDFGRPLKCIGLFGDPSTGQKLNAPDSYLCPLPPETEIRDVLEDIGVPA